MGESNKHRELVQRIRAMTSRIIPPGLEGFIQVDVAGESSTPNIGGYCPDLYYHFNGQLVVGEAKTANDFDTEHSRKQLEAYLEQCRLNNGESTLIVAVTWTRSITAKNFFKRNKELWQGVTILVLDDAGMVYEL